MQFSELCIKRPVLTIVLNVLILIAGVIGFNSLKLRELPQIQLANITIENDAPNLTSHIIESEITNKIEAQLNGLSNLKRISSISKNSKSTVKLKFNSSAKLEESANQVRDLVGRIQADFPKGTLASKVIKADTASDPSLYIGIQSKLYDQTKLSEFVDKYILHHIENIQGVAKVAVYGERKPSLHVLLNMNKLRAHNLTIENIEQVINQATHHKSGGIITYVSHQMNIDIAPLADNIKKLKSIVVQADEFSLVHLQDIAQIKQLPENEDITTKVNSKDAVVLAIIPKMGANPVLLSSRVNQYFNTLKERLPRGIHTETLFDQAVFIKASLKEVAWTLLFSTVLVGVIIYLMTGGILTSVIPLLTVPVSIIGIFSMMWCAGFTINLLTMLALVLAIGLVVDDAIVMLENIERHLKQAHNTQKAASIAVKEITNAVISMSITLAIVFIPIALSQNTTGQLFREFALTLSGAVLISGFVALSLTPMLAARWLNFSHMKGGAYQKWLQRRLQRLEAYYHVFLQKCFARVGLISLIFVFACLVGSFFYWQLTKEVIPQEDKGMVFVPVIAPTGVNHRYTDKWLQQVEKIFAQVPEMIHFGTASGFGGGNQGFAILKLKPWHERKASSTDIQLRIMPLLMSLPGVNAFPVLPSSFYAQAEGNVSVVLSEDTPFEYLKAQADKVQLALQENPNLTEVQVKLNFAQDELQFAMYPDNIAQNKLDVEQISNILTVYTHGKKIGELNIHNRLLPIYLKSQQEIASSDNFKNVYIPNKENKYIPLAQVGQLQIKHLPNERYHFNKIRAVTISARIIDSPSISSLKQTLTKQLKQILPKGMQFEFKGAIKNYTESSHQMAFTFAMALLMIFLVLAAQFESFIAPIIILCVVPVTIAGAWFGLYLFGLTFNIYSQIACVTLIGLISKHGILMVEFANQITKQGQQLQDAIILAAKTRLRPILMTTMACVVGAVPLAIASGPGSAARNSIGVAVVFGMSLGTICSLCFVPVAYYLLYRNKVSVNRSMPYNGYKN